MTEKSESKPEGRYHHGNLRQALLEAAEKELNVRGVEAFSMRQVAIRARVSHAAPAHHFGDANGVLTALAAVGFRRFVAAQEARQAQAPREPRAQLIAAGQGYLDFAFEHPAMFRLMFASRRPDLEDEDLCAASKAAYDKLVAEVCATAPHAAPDDISIAAVWALTHGLADLLSSGRLRMLQHMTGAQRDAAVAAVIGRLLRA